MALGEPLPIEIVAAFLRLGNKYKIEVLRAEALKRLFHEYPLEVRDFDEMGHWSMIESGAWVISDTVKLAREQNLLSVLPVALYIVCRDYSAEEIMGSISKSDGSLRPVLNSVDQCLCLAAYVRLLQTQGDTTLSWINSSSSYPHCEDSSTCCAVRQRLICKIFFPVAALGGLGYWEQDWEERMCESCVAIAKDLHDEGRANFWDALPSIFDLPEWAELKKDRVSQWCVIA